MRILSALPQGFHYGDVGLLGRDRVMQTKNTGKYRCLIRIILMHNMIRERIEWEELDTERSRVKVTSTAVGSTCKALDRHVRKGAMIVLAR